jgi:DNA-binding CsgD family transcriptional regulator
MTQANGLDPDQLIATLGRTGDAMVALDADLHVVGWNAAAEQLLGYPAAEAMGRLCYDVLGWEDPCGNTVCSGTCPSANPASPDEVQPTREVIGHTAAGSAMWMTVSTITPPPELRDRCRVVHLIREVAFPPALIRILGSQTASSPGTDDTSGRLLDRLTAREREVLDLLCEGCDGAAIAERLYLSGTTVRNHVQRILAKLEVHSRVEAVALALRQRT